MRPVFERLILFTLVVELMAFAFSSPVLAKRKEEKKLLPLLPTEKQLPQWQLSEKPRFFDATNLFEYIDGAADLYIMYGFIGVITADYASSSDAGTATVEIYHMSTPEHAFGIYAAERSPDQEAVDIGTKGYLGTNILNFCKGPYYVKITSFAVGKDVRSALQAMAQSIAANIKGEFKEPEIFALFPKEELVPNSQRFIPSNFLGQSYLSNGYRCDYYNEQCGNYQLFLVPMKDEVSARTAFASYKKFLLERKQPHRIDQDVDYERILQYGSEQNNFAFWWGSYIGGANGSGCPDQLKNRMQELEQNVRGR